MLNKKSFWFWLFFSLAIAKPIHFSDANRYLGAILYLLILGVIFYYNIQKPLYQVYFKKYKWDVLLICLFVGSLLISLLFHINFYPSLKIFLAYGVGSLVVLSTLPLCWFIFHESNGKTIFGDILLVFLHLVALLEFLDYNLTKPLIYYSVAADAMHPGYITSLMRWHTIYGTIAALSFIYSINKLRYISLKTPKIFYVLLSVFSLIGGALSTSRNFLWASFWGILTFLFISKNKRRTFIFCLGLILFLFFSIHILILAYPKIGYRYGQFLPYFSKIVHHKKIRLRDLKPRIFIKKRIFLAGRIPIWKKGLALWKQSPYLGIGPGMFRVKSKLPPIHNLHNFFLQILVEGGLISFGLLCLLLIRLGYYAYRTGVLPIYLTMLAALMFDNYLDHSMGWAITVAWMLQPLTP